MKINLTDTTNIGTISSVTGAALETVGVNMPTFMQIVGCVTLICQVYLMIKKDFETRKNDK